MASLLSDGELRKKLLSLGVDVGPITATTRPLYQTMLRKKLQETKRPGFGSPTTVNRRTPGVVEKNKRIPVKLNCANERGSSSSTSGRRRPAPSDSRPVPKKIKLDKDSIERVQPNVARLYPTLPGDTSEQPMEAQEEEDFSPSAPPLSLVRIPKPNLYNRSPDRLEMSPPSPNVSPPSPSVSSGDSSFSSPPPPGNSGGGLVNFMTGLIGAGVKKIVQGIQDAASPRPPLRSVSAKKRSSSFRQKRRSDSSSQSRGSHLRRDHNSIPIDEIDFNLSFNDFIGEASSSVSLQSPPGSSSKRPSSSSSLSSVDDYDWELLPKDVEICRKSDGSLWILGKGGFGEVYKGIKDGVDEVAIKVIRVSSNIVVDQFKQEIDLISKLRHRHILQFYGACIQPTSLYMVTELMQCDLFSALRSDPRYQWSGIYGKEVLVGVAAGLHYLHSRRPPVVHRDIKSPNILLMDGIAKIADVGIARTKAASDMTAQRGFTIAWAAPEVVYRKRATEKIDIWSFGVIIWEVATGKLPHPGRLDLPTQSPHALVNLYRRCVSEEATRRPNAADAVKELRAINT